MQILASLFQGKGHFVFIWRKKVKFSFIRAGYELFLHVRKNSETTPSLIGIKDEVLTLKKLHRETYNPLLGLSLYSSEPSGSIPYEVSFSGPSKCLTNELLCTYHYFSQGQGLPSATSLRYKTLLFLIKFQPS